MPRSRSASPSAVSDRCPRRLAKALNPLPNAFDAIAGALGSAAIRYAVGGSWASTAFGDPRFTNDVDILADLTPENLARFLSSLPDTFYADPEAAERAVRSGRPFNIIHMPSVLKFDFFPAASFPLGADELNRAVVLRDSGLSKGPVRFVTPEDILLAKLHWFKTEGEVSEVQWRDIRGVARAGAKNLDRAYLERSAATIGVRHLLEQALADA